MEEISKKELQLYQLCYTISVIVIAQFCLLGKGYFMKILKNASAGTMESSDVYVEIEPGCGINLQLESVVAKQFGDSIRNVVSEVLREQGITDASVRIVDRGALECVIRARVETAILRGKG